MKNIRLFLVVILGALLSITSCENDEQGRQLTVTSPYEQLGQMHNQGLEYVYNQLANSPNLEEFKNNQSVEERYDYVKKAMLAFTRSKGATEEELQLCEVHLSQNLADRLSKQNGCLPSYSVLTHNEGGKKSFELQTQLKELYTIMTDEDENLPSLTHRLDQLEQQAAGLLNPQDLHILKCGTAVAKHTLQYWLSGAGKWQQLLAPRMSRAEIQLAQPAQPALPVQPVIASNEEDDGFSFKELGVADVEGAVGEAVAESFVWLFGPAGASVSFVGIVAGAAAESVVNALDQCIRDDKKDEEKNNSKK